jgi:very-short-patch-repair endonuclease
MKNKRKYNDQQIQGLRERNIKKFKESQENEKMYAEINKLVQQRVKKAVQKEKDLHMAKSESQLKTAEYFKEKLLKSMTETEQHICTLLDLAFVKYEAQKIIHLREGKFIIVDFCIQDKYILELDGGQHFEEIKMFEDSVRDHILKQMGYTVKRVSNALLKNITIEAFKKYLHSFKNPKKLSTYKRKDIVRFGKHKGKSVEELLAEDPKYLIWMFRTEICIFEKDILKLLDIRP